MSAAPQWNEWAGVDVSVHLYPGSQLSATVHAEDARAVLHLRGENFVGVHVFADRAELARLADAVNAARDALDAAIPAAADPKDAAHAA